MEFYRDTHTQCLLSELASAEDTHRDDCPRPVHHINSHLHVPLGCLGALTEGAILQSHIDVITGITYSKKISLTPPLSPFLPLSPLLPSAPSIHHTW